MNSIRVACEHCGMSDRFSLIIYIGSRIEYKCECDWEGRLYLGYIATKVEDDQ